MVMQYAYCGSITKFLWLHVHERYVIITTRSTDTILPFTLSSFSELFVYGVGFHHAGMDTADRKTVEAMFTAGDLPVLCKPQAVVTSSSHVELCASVSPFSYSLHKHSGHGCKQLCVAWQLSQHFNSMKIYQVTAYEVDFLHFI